MLRIIGAGLSRTGTLSLNTALEMLGFRSLHFDLDRLKDVLEGVEASPNFRRFDDVDAVTDLPAAYFWRELSAAYPGSKVILTVRDLDGWWSSIQEHFGFYHVPEESRIKHKLGKRFRIKFLQEHQYPAVRRRLRNYVYGSPKPTEFLYKKRFVEHNEHVMAYCPPERLLVMDIAAGDGWEKLCPFLDVRTPNAPFPHEHRTDSGELMVT